MSVETSITKANKYLLSMIRFYLKYAFWLYPLWFILFFIIIGFAFAGDSPSFYEPNKWGWNIWEIIGMIFVYLFNFSILFHLFSCAVILIKATLDPSKILESTFCLLYAFLSILSFFGLFIFGGVVFIISNVIGLIFLYLHQKQSKENNRELLY